MLCLVLVEQLDVFVHLALVQIAGLIVLEQHEVVAGQNQDDEHVDEGGDGGGNVHHRPDKAGVAALLEQAGLPPNSRGETFTAEEFFRLYKLAQKEKR